jgi:hypothetical protein
VRDETGPAKLIVCIAGVICAFVTHKPAAQGLENGEPK